MPDLLPETCPFQQLLDEWLDACRADGLSPKTREDYIEKVSKFRWWWVEYSKKPPHPENVTTKDIRAYAAYLREPLAFRWGLPVQKNKETLAAASIHSYGRAVRVFFFWLEREGYIDKCPFNRTVKFTTKKQDRIVKRVAENDLARIFTVLSQDASKDSYVGLRNLAIVSLLVDSVIRRGELLSIKLCDIDFRAGRCAVLGKTGSRYALFSDTCKRALSRYYRKWRNSQDSSPTSHFWLTEDGEPLSDAGFGSLIKRLEDRCGVDIHAHKFRHTFGSMMAQQGTNIFDLKEMMGHTTITTTQIYVHGEPEHLSRVHRTNSPLSTLNNGTQERVKRRRGRPRKTQK